MEDKLVTIATFTDYIEAELTKQMLEDAGIPVVITGQNFTNMLPIPLASEISLQTLQCNAKQALEILNAAEK